MTVTDETGTSVVGAQYGIAGYSLSTGSGSVTINVATNATISAGALYGNVGILAIESNAGNISITTATGDIVNSGGSGIEAINQATTASAASQISIQAAGAITSGYNNGENGIYAEYSGGAGTVNANVAGNIVLDSTAVISAPVGDGIGLDNWGTGNITATLESSGSITADINGVDAAAKGGGNVSITNKGPITVTAGAGIHAQTGTGVLNGVSGVISINNSGTVTALGSALGPVIEINNGSTQAATFTNTGTVTANLLAETGSSVAVGDFNGSVTVNNSGTISGNVQLATATFNNNAGGIWNVRGSNYVWNRCQCDYQCRHHQYRRRQFLFGCRDRPDIQQQQRQCRKHRGQQQRHHQWRRHWQRNIFNRQSLATRFRQFSGSRPRRFRSPAATAC